MEQIKIDDQDIRFIYESCPSLVYDQKQAKIYGEICFNLLYPDSNGIQIQDSYSIEISLLSRPGSILPTVRETQGRILKIAERKEIDYHDLHLNTKEGEMCLIIPMKEKERYPDGFDIKIFIEHLRQHLYWISYYERYDKEPWKGQGHGDKGVVELYKENPIKYSASVKTYFENKNGTTYSWKTFRQMMSCLIKCYKL